MLAGSADVGALARRAPKLASFDGEALTLPGVEILQVTYELGGVAPEAPFPPALHPTLPVLAVLAVWRAAAGPLGPFALAQWKLSCRSGARPRQLLVGSFADGEPARAALNERFAFAAAPARVRLERGYDRVAAGVELGGRAVLDVTGRGPLPLATGDLQFFSSVHAADTPTGLRLVQIDAEYAVARAERAAPEVACFDAAAFGLPGARLAYPVAAFVAVADVTLPRVRFVSRADVPAFAGTERVS
ncbi:MAG TPA: hypothetical protein VMR31_19420 [Myxococcota bacterium]|nr:hypothetical protein [Myxococcota bacterium]